MITDRDRHHLLQQAQAAMGEPAADTLMASLYPGDADELVTKEYLGLRLDAAIAGVLAKIASLETKMWRMVAVILVGQAVLPPVVERLMETFS